MLLNWRKSRRPVRRRWRRATKSVTPSRECQKPARGCEPTSFVLALPTATSIRHSRAEHHPQRENHCYIGLGAVIQQAPAIDEPPFAACHRRAERLCASAYSGPPGPESSGAAAIGKFRVATRPSQLDPPETRARSSHEGELLPPPLASDREAAVRKRRVGVQDFRILVCVELAQPTEVRRLFLGFHRVQPRGSDQSLDGPLLDELRDPKYGAVMFALC